MSGEWIFLSVWAFLWLVIVPFTPARALLATAPGRWAERFMAALARVFDRFFTWLAGRILAAGRWRP